jgi:UDP-3-O-[3-hydroxymyristoyl] glucosamine N-acyltransferase
MAYYSETQLREMNFKSLGVNVKISDKASLYDCHNIALGDNSRVDDYCVISGNVVIKSYCHITPMCLIVVGELGILLKTFAHWHMV